MIFFDIQLNKSECFLDFFLISVILCKTWDFQYFENVGGYPWDLIKTSFPCISYGCFLEELRSDNLKGFCLLLKSVFVKAQCFYNLSIKILCHKAESKRIWFQIGAISFMNVMCHFDKLGRSTLVKMRSNFLK